MENYQALVKMVRAHVPLKVKDSEVIRMADAILDYNKNRETSINRNGDVVTVDGIEVYIPIWLSGIGWDRIEDRIADIKRYFDLYVEIHSTRILLPTTP